MDSMAEETILLSLADSVLFNITEEKYAHDLWNNLAKLYEMKSLANKILLRR